MKHDLRSRPVSLLRYAAAAAIAAITVAACATGEAPAEPTATTSSALGITGLFPTGVDGNGTPLATGTVDAHYTLASADPTLGLMPRAFAVDAQASMAGAGAWTPNTASSKWISVRASAVSTLPLLYTYSTTFNLNGADPTTATLTGALACDDTCVLRLNGTDIKTFASPAWTQATAFSVPAGSPFVAGNNTLSVAVTNSGGIVTGLQITKITPGCTTDSQCASTQFCNTQTNACTPKLPDGTPVPTIPGHAPPLTGTCSAPVGTAVCVSGTCSTTTNDCGATAPPACTTDGQCASGQFCNTQTMTCTPKLPDGTPVPTIPGHTPPLTGTCATDVGTAVCVSGTCNTTTNDCGPAVTPPPACTMDSQCASTQFCDTQTMTCTSKLPDGAPVPTVPGHTPPLTGTCATGVGAVVCISGACDATSNLCGSGCTKDSDCASTQFCDTQTMACTPKLPNGDMIPTLTGHTPDLTGMCTTPVGAAVCASAVCDMTNDECGFANGDGPCTAANGGVVCQSGVCAASGTCAPGATCTMDSDCAATQFCNTQIGTCTAKLPNGTPIPTLSGHTPPLAGMCTTDTGAAVCIAAVCDPGNDECGLANGDGPCTIANGPTLCQSGVCNAGGTCGPGQMCTVDADCTNPATPLCDPTRHLCVPAQDAGTPDAGNGGDDGGPTTTPNDAGSPPPKGDGSADQSGFVEGGGCAVTPANTPSRQTGELLLVGAAALVLARRRRR
jgi:MYXO-CTERM domain-containing protein